MPHFSLTCLSITDGAVLECVSKVADPARAAKKLAFLANSKRSSANHTADDVTVIVVDLDKPQIPSLG